jgi:beta-1,4-N-acetylglucosaminyltransferase
VTRRKIALVGSSGGHLAHLLVLRPWWSEHDRFWVTFDTEDAVAALADERTYWCHHPTNRNVRNLILNTILAVRILVRERPAVIVSAGAAVAVPFFYLGRVFGARTMFIEVVDRVHTPSLTGRLVAPVSTEIIVQWAEQKPFFRKPRLVGRLL